MKFYEAGTTINFTTMRLRIDHIHNQSGNSENEAEYHARQCTELC